MKIQLKFGIDKLLFGMKQKDVIALYGKPNREFKDEDQNVIFLYNNIKLRLTFYEDEDMKLGYIIASDPHLELFNKKIIFEKIDDVLNQFQEDGIQIFEKESFDSTESYFNEENWLTIETEFDEVQKIEIGAIININDEFEWKF